MEFWAHCKTPGHQLECGICSKRFKSKNLRDLHKRIHLMKKKNSNRKGEFKCPHCLLVYGYKTNLDRHIKTTHEHRVFLCEDCGASFKTNFDLKQHISVKHKNDSVEKKPFQCEFCGKNFRVKGQLKIHSAEAHLGHTDICNYCKESFDGPEKLREHIEALNHHSFQCNKCSASFKAKAHLITHLLKHDTVKVSIPRAKEKINKKEVKYPRLANGKYPCQICAKQFGSASNLMRHLNLHSDVKKYKCDKCGKSFKQDMGLKNHMSVHSEERPYECQTCGSRFKDSSTFCKHKKVHCENTFLKFTGKKLKSNKLHNRSTSKEAAHTPSNTDGLRANENNALEIHVKPEVLQLDSKEFQTDGNIVGAIWIPHKLP